jgi:hypothetical protein
VFGPQKYFQERGLTDWSIGETHPERWEYSSFVDIEAKILIHFPHVLQDVRPVSIPKPRMRRASLSRKLSNIK